MAEIGTLQTVQQGNIHITSVIGDSLRPAQIAIATVEFPQEEYDGPTVFTPSEYQQIIAINGKVATDNITINPIPSNWGRISYNGYVLTVS